mgnify:FL=1
MANRTAVGQNNNSPSNNRPNVGKNTGNRLIMPDQPSPGSKVYRNDGLRNDLNMGEGSDPENAFCYGGKSKKSY